MYIHDFSVLVLYCSGGRLLCMLHFLRVTFPLFFYCTNTSIGTVRFFRRYFIIQPSVGNDLPVEVSCGICSSIRGLNV